MANKRLTLSQFKEIAKEQLQLVLLDEECAVKALTKCPAGRAGVRRGAGRFGALLVAPGPLVDEEKSRVARVEQRLA